MIIGYAGVSTKEQELRFQHDDLKPAFDASVDVTNGTSLRAWLSVRIDVQSGEGTWLPAAQRSPAIDSDPSLSPLLAPGWVTPPMAGLRCPCA
jgi:hypothetical protein